MYNNDLYKQLEKKFGEEKMLLVSEILTEYYNILYLETRKMEELLEYGFEKEWWGSKYEDLIKEVNNH